MTLKSWPTNLTDGPMDIRGVQPQDRNKPPIRKELREMKKNPKEWTLFLLGMERFHEQKESDDLSYYEIAGIHGLPFRKWPNRSWNKVIATDPEKFYLGPEPFRTIKQWQGYCTHSSILFLPWHRPYLALIEAALYEHVNAIAQMYTEEEGRSEYVKIAQDFRFPFWDFLLSAKDGADLFPTECLIRERHEGYVIRPAKQERENILEYNPIGSYRFQPGGEAYNNPDINLDPSNATIRYPNNKDGGISELRRKFDQYFFQKPGQDGNGNPKKHKWAGKGSNVTERAVYILESYNSFTKMSHNKYDEKDPTNWGSIEDLHNAIHDIVGGNGGHMSDQRTSAFDPIFWLHHCNIDRLWALWHALHDNPNDPVTQVVRERTKEGTYTIDIEAYEDGDTDLAPWTNTEDAANVTYWKARQVGETRQFGYVYEETQQHKYPTKGDVSKAIRNKYKLASLANLVLDPSPEAHDGLVRRAKFQRKLAELGSTNTAAMIGDAVKGDTPVLMDDDAIDSIELPDRSIKDLLSSNNSYSEWLFNIKAQKHYNGGDFVVHAFLGPPDDGSKALYLADPNHVSIFSTFGAPQSTGCKKCRVGQEDGLVVTGQIPLTMALVERYLAGEVASLKAQDVVPYLQQNLHWRVTNKNMERLSPADVSDLLIVVVSNQVTVPSDADGTIDFSPTVEAHPEATTNLRGESRGEGTGYVG